MDESGDTQAGELLPRPDPTRLTSAALIREITTLREQVFREMVALREILQTRLDGMDKALQLLQRAGTKCRPRLTCASRR
jgi:hypothetical protein